MMGSIVYFGKAVNEPRLHCENDLLSIEHGYDHSQLLPLLNTFTKNLLWERYNLFLAVCTRSPNIAAASPAPATRVAMALRSFFSNVA